MAKPTEKWKRKNKHANEVAKVLKDFGHLDRTGKLEGWIGRETYVALNKNGHTSIDFDKCGCNHD